MREKRDEGREGREGGRKGGKVGNVNINTYCKVFTFTSKLFSTFLVNIVK